MSYVLYGSKTSPFVRRIRVLLDQIPFEFKEINLFEGQDAIDLHKLNPLNQIPVLVDGENTIWDSRQIFNYFNSIHHFQSMDWKDENLLTAIDGAMNAGVSLLLMKRSGIDLDEQFMYVNRQKDRMESVLDYLKPFILGRAKERWDFHAISLYCYLDWAIFRKLLNLSERPECQMFLDQYKTLPIISETDIPRS